MKVISVKLEVPEWVDEEKFVARLKRMAEKMIHPEKLSAEQIREILGLLRRKLSLLMSERRRERLTGCGLRGFEIE